MAEEEKREGEAKAETKEEKKAKKAKEKADKKAAKAAAKAAKKGGAAPAEGEAGAEGGEKKEGEEAATALGPDGQPLPVEAPKSKKKLIIIIVAAVLLLGGGGAGVMMSGILGGGEDKEKTAEEALTAEHIMYHDMEEFLVNLNNPGTQISFLKAVITLELPNQLSLNEVQDKMPKIRDVFQVYLRELRNSDLQGSAGLQRLRVELLLRINSVMEKGKVNNILFKEIIIQ